MIWLKSCFLSKNTAKQTSFSSVEFKDAYSLIGDVINLDYLVEIQVLSDFFFLYNV